MNSTMNRWEIPSLGLDKLVRREVPRPVPKAGEIVVEVNAVSLNYRDAEVAENGMGNALSFPFTPASDMAGRIVAVGEGVTRFAVGDRVISAYIPGWIDGVPLSWTVAPTQGGPIPGVLAQYVAAPAEWCVRAPRTLSAVEASTLPVAALTAWMALVELGNLHAGQTVVVQGTGGVSLFAVQLAAAHGARVIVTSGSDEKIARAIALGARHGINRNTTPDWQHAVLELTGGRGADHILEMTGGDNVERSLQAVVQGGRISVIGLLDSDRLSLPILSLLASRASIVGIAVGPRRALEDLVRAVDLLGIRPVIDATYAYSQVPEAFVHLRRGAFGKIVVQLSEA
ncbi:zinc-binding dehydrogenase family protein [Paraburkholderia xenovorans LB400]|uniref:Zinc-containing alcohol dehydrogenase n=1 Tax=Paraburkholderia xenovorans (strain LB400) TaxID=266265 RepID=Q13GD6_PARXL|nr:NAD(P)-dependent alcohol dehydrogenase [Paraburkholderia xenovorans]ABE36853.1 Putative Zinc-containing alcohol dehydrogenase [Paraburkholderia xenovorans LB400]AIP34658.1 zinc-binding dehydrogenase family protein [Paraburkholderia xenovorans LB400]